MQAVSDTTVITTLLKSEEVALVRELFDGVLIPPAVHTELRAFHSDLPDFLHLEPLAEPDLLPASTSTLGRGEAEAIGLALQIRADVFLTDDRRAATAARKLGLECVGLLGLLLLAKRKRLIASVSERILTMQRKGGLYLSEAVKAEARRLAGE